jgi:DNA uptake protein ComE-like DNA-binding protein
MLRLKDYFYLYSSDRKVLLFCLVTAAIVIGLIVFLGKDVEDTSFSEVAVDSTQQAHGVKWEKGSNGYYEVKAREVHLVPFDPNTADSTTLLGLGLQPWQVRNIYKYRAAGGIYRKPSDFARLYGLTQKQYRQLAPYIRISSDYRPAAELFASEGSGYNEGNGFNGRTKSAGYDSIKPIRHKLAPNEHVALNLADTTALMRVPGIGSYFARRIVSYQKRLGGFYSVEQLKEIDDFPVEALPYFQVAGNVKKLNVNQLSIKELKHHPYINYYQAKAICDYRRLYGPLHSLSQLKLLKDFTPKDLERLSHYVTF